MHPGPGVAERDKDDTELRTPGAAPQQGLGAKENMQNQPKDALQAVP